MAYLNADDQICEQQKPHEPQKVKLGKLFRENKLFLAYSDTCCLRLGQQGPRNRSSLCAYTFDSCPSKFGEVRKWKLAVLKVSQAPLIIKEVQLRFQPAACGLAWKRLFQLIAGCKHSGPAFFFFGRPLATCSSIHPYSELMTSALGFGVEEWQ